MAKPAKNILHTAPQQAETSPKRAAGIVAVEGCIISITDFSAREGARTVRTINLNDFMLPPTKIYRLPVPLGSRSDLVEGIAEAALCLGRRTSPTSRAGANAVVKAIRSMSKFVEFGWLNGLYTWEDWTPVTTRSLLNRLGKGGWAGALDLVARTEQFIQRHRRDEIAQLIQPSLALSGGFSLKVKFSIDLGTNLQGTELVPAKLMMLEHLGTALKDPTSNRGKARAIPKKRSSDAGMGASHLRQEMTAINLLAEAGDHPPLTFMPYPDTVKLSTQYGRAVGRTANLTPDIVADLLKESFWWIEDVADPLVATCEHLLAKIDESVRSGQPPMDLDELFEALQTAPALKNLESMLGLSITSVGRNMRADETHISLKQVIYAMATAAFVTIGILNARRKDEISHRKIGLHRRALRVVSRELRLYECEFFIEKSSQTYIPFYVSQTSQTAIRVLERLSDIARALKRIFTNNQFSPVDEREDKLFQLPQFHAKLKKGGSQWYSFLTGLSGHSDYFVWRALGGRSVRIHPHMFRRAYALIHHYRYEHATLQQLCQQLAHFDLAQTVVYVRDAGSASNGTPATAYAHRNDATHRAQVAAISELKQEIAEVARDRVRDLVSQVVNNGPRATGGFARLIQRFHQRLGSRIDYQVLGRSAQVKKLSDSLISHGHAFRPMPHANCVASPTRKNSAAKCYSTDAGRLARERASVSTCTDCPYGHWVEGHHAALEEDIDFLEAEVSRNSVSIKGRAQVIELGNVKRVLELRKKRLGGAKGHPV